MPDEPLMGRIIQSSKLAGFSAGNREGNYGTGLHR